MPASKHRSSGVNLGTKHICAHGFSWTTLYPDRTAAVLGERRPLATITGTGETLTGEQLEPFEVPIAVARNLDASNAPEPTSSAELLARVREAADACAWSRIVAMASRREHSSLEVARRLERDGYGPACVEGAVEHARNAGIVSDERFADSFVRAKLGAGWGPMRIERELSLVSLMAGRMSTLVTRAALSGHAKYCAQEACLPRMPTLSSCASWHLVVTHWQRRARPHALGSTSLRMFPWLSPIGALIDVFRGSI